MEEDEGRKGDRRGEGEGGIVGGDREGNRSEQRGEIKIGGRETEEIRKNKRGVREREK